MNADPIQQSFNNPKVAPSGWSARFRRQGFYFRHVAIATILGGLYLHISRVLLGDDLLLQYVFTPLFDRVLTVPMFYAGLTGILTWNQIQFHNTLHKIAYGLGLFYIAGSVPLHIWNAYLKDTTEYIRWFPLWFTFLLFPIYTGIIMLVWRLRYKDDAK